MNCMQVFKIYKIIEFENKYTLSIKNSHNLVAHQIVRILFGLCHAHVVFTDQYKFVFNINNFIYRAQFNQSMNFTIWKKV